MRVWLVRHGAAEVGPGIAIGSTDAPLSPGGVEQARHLALTLAERPIGRVISSDLRRASDTAAAIAGPHSLAVERTPALREIDLGAWEGRRLSDLWLVAPDQATAWERDLRATPAGFGESLRDLELRVTGWWRELAPIATETVVVGHRGSLVILLMSILGITLEAAWRWRCSTGTAVAC